MTDQNSLARAYASDHSEDDPLAELARIVSGEAPRPAPRPAALPQPVFYKYKPAERRIEASAFQAPQTPSAPAAARAIQVSLEDALMAELGMGEAAQAAETDAETEAAVYDEPDAAIAEPEMVAEIAVAELSLEEQLLAELNFDGEASFARSQPENAAFAQGEPPAAVAEPDFDDLEAILEVEFESPAAAANEDHYAEAFNTGETVEAEDLTPHAQEEILEEIIPGQPPIDEFDAIFQREIMNAAAPAAIRKPAISLATPVAPRREAITEREMEDHFAAAFAEELSLGISKTQFKGPERTSIANAAAPAAAVAKPGSLAQKPSPAAFDPVQDASHYDPVMDFQQDWDDGAPAAESAAPNENASHEDRPAVKAGGFSRSFLLAAGALAIALLLGGGALAFGYFSGNDLVAGEPVIVKADTTPVKVKPENPGGTQIANQDQAAYDKVAGATGDGAAQERLVTTSEEPVEIAKLAEGGSAGETRSLDAASAGTVTDAGDVKAEERLSAGVVEPSDPLPALAPRRVKTLLIKPDGTVVDAPAEPAPVQGTGATAFAPVEETARDAASAALEPIDGVIRQTGEVALPEGRPAPEQTAQAASVPAAPASTDTTAAPAATSPDAAVLTGEWAVQLASQRSAEDAQATFANLKQKFPSVLGDKPLAVQRAEVEGKGVFYRVRVPAQTKEEAVELCERLKAAGGSCFIAR